ncbi:uncharacterized protein LOC127098462 [Lathyrus oleraceus]|uniref:uncharacterized protein LOC127098462 n=1 Tax=Pisum sativum TaxID=3888 RepID=UPI0021D2D4BF|nr:uncharacterized protein LOC127098462 [Pisum sativum]
MPHHLAASLTSEGAFFPHSALATTAGNSGFPWVLPALHTTPVIAIDPEDNQGQAGAPQAPNAQPGMQYFQPPIAQPGMQYFQPPIAAQTVPPGFSYPPMWFNPNIPAPIAHEASRSASQVAPPVVDPTKLADYQLLDDRIRAIGGFSSFGIDARDLCLVPNVVLPQKFKVPDLPKYKGLSCPRIHLTMYCRKMASHIDNDNLLIHCFQDSLTGASLDWYISLERSKIRSWRDLSEAFLKQYKYNLDMAPTRLQLQNQSQRSNETFKEYAQRWHEMASGFINKFSDMVTIGERVESGLKPGKITDTNAPQSANKRPHGGFAKKKEGEANAVMAKARPRYRVTMAPMSYYPYPYVVAAQYQQPPFQYQPQRSNQQPTPAQKDQNRQYNRDNRGQNQGSNNRGNYGKRTHYDKISVPYTDLTNPLPNHDGPSVSVIIEEEPAEPVKWVDEVKTPFSVVLRKLEEFGFLEGVHSDCSVCESNPDGYEQLRECVQELMNQGIIQFSKSKAAKEVAMIEPITIVYKKKKVEAPPKRIQPIHFRVPTPFLYQNTKAMPWNYETTAYWGRKEICIPDTEIVNIAGAGGMNLSGRVFAPKYTPRVSPAPTVV